MIITHNKFKFFTRPVPPNRFQCVSIFSSKFPPTEGETPELAIAKMKHAIDQWERDTRKAISTRRSIG
jgi:hypothetical protein